MQEALRDREEVVERVWVRGRPDYWKARLLTLCCCLCCCLCCAATALVPPLPPLRPTKLETCAPR
jgi:hypothetical protein